ncbi:hypothetical protein [Dankookia sp. P2]|uniref:hypothetical protein n=1 Tax=Dankookia sp. P2 TaxID=3423955 RepID=UPI003D66CEBE
MAGRGSVALSIEARMAADRSGTQYFLLAGPDGRRLAGNLAAVPRAPGWERLQVSGAGVETALLALGTALPGAASWWWGGTSPQCDSWKASCSRPPAGWAGPPCCSASAAGC